MSEELNAYLVSNMRDGLICGVDGPDLCGPVNLVSFSGGANKPSSHSLGPALVSLENEWVGLECGMVDPAHNGLPDPTLVELVFVGRCNSIPFDATPSSAFLPPNLQFLEVGFVSSPSIEMDGVIGVSKMPVSTLQCGSDVELPKL